MRLSAHFADGSTATANWVVDVPGRKPSTRPTLPGDYGMAASWTEGPGRPDPHHEGVIYRMYQCGPPAGSYAAEHRAHV